MMKTYEEAAIKFRHLNAKQADGLVDSRLCFEIFGSPLTEEILAREIGDTQKPEHQKLSVILVLGVMIGIEMANGEEHGDAETKKPKRKSHAHRG